MAGIPQDIVVDLARSNASTVFVETGTYHGHTTRWAAAHFENVHTIERSQQLYDRHSAELARLPGVTPHLGDSKEILPGIVSCLGDRRALFWLDGHWSCGETAGERDECPLLGELASLSTRTQDIILIDDAQFFLCTPPAPHDPSQWPSFADIIDALPFVSGRRPFVQIIDDVIFIVPAEGAVQTRLLAYARNRATKSLEDIARWRQARHPITTLKHHLRRVAHRMIGS
jgi:hypothetical protein